MMDLLLNMGASPDLENVRGGNYRDILALTDTSVSKRDNFIPLLEIRLSVIQDLDYILLLPYKRELF